MFLLGFLWRIFTYGHMQITLSSFQQGEHALLGMIEEGDLHTLKTILIEILYQPPMVRYV